MKKLLSERRQLYMMLFLVIIILAVYGQVVSHDFVNYDDDYYVYDNRYVKKGISFQGFLWAFSSGYASNWHPLTWLSHMLDIQLFGLNPGWHHLMNVLFHVFSTLLLFFVLQRMTSAFWESAFVAALFALHPLHVESVAWIAERKDVLSAFFWMLVMWFYVLYVEKPVFKRYFLVLFFFILGLLSKPMLVTLPFVLLLLDYWPLKRLDSVIPEKNGEKKAFFTSRIFIEKIPLFFLTVVSCFITFLVQKTGGSVASLEKYSFTIRIYNVIAAYCDYLWKMLWPVKMAVIYPLPDHFSVIKIILYASILFAITFYIIKSRKNCPYLALGWFWYLGTLVPVIGLIQIGVQSMADRYTYIPLIGIFIMIAWGIPRFLEDRQYKREILSAGSVLILLCCVIGTSIQLGHWKNGVTLFRHALAVTKNNYMAHLNLGAALSDREGDFDKAIVHLQKAIEIKPSNPKAYNDLGVILARKGSLEQSVSYLKEAVRIKPDYAEAYVNLGVVLNRMGRSDEALSAYDEALKLNPDDANAHLNLGVALAQMGELDKAVFHFRETLRINPDDIDAKNNLKILSEVLEKSRYNR